jgi:hypothetical protein
MLEGKPPFRASGNLQLCPMCGEVVVAGTMQDELCVACCEKIGV